MNVSLRFQMTAGVAAMGAAVVAVTPITQPELLPSAQRVAAAVELSALANPISVLTGTIDWANQWVFDQSELLDFRWPESFYGIRGRYAPENVGAIADAANQFSFGALSAVINNLSGYGYAAGSGVLGLVGGVSESIFNTPFAVVAAAQELIGGDPEAALQTLVTAIVGPVQDGVELALAAAGYIVENVISNIQTVVTSTLPFLVSGLAAAVVGGLTFIAESAFANVGQVVADLGAGQFEEAWNTAVFGFLGAGGTLGQIVDQTIGIGQYIVGEPGETGTVTVPSVRAVLTSELQRLGDFSSLEDGGIGNDPFYGAPEAAAAVNEPAPVAAMEVSAPAVTLESAPAPVETAPVAVAEATAPVGEPDATSQFSAVSEADAASSPAAAPSEAQAGDSDGAAAKTPKRGHRGAKNARGAN